MTQPIVIDMTEFDKLRRRVAGSETVLREEISRSARASGFLLQDRAKQLAPVGKENGGNLKGTVQPPEVQVAMPTFSVVVRATASYARYVEEGIEGIRPVRAKVLAWKNNSGWHFAMKVGPRTGKYFMRNALQYSRTGITQLFTAGAKRAANRLAGGG